MTREEEPEVVEHYKCQECEAELPGYEKSVEHLKLTGHRIVGEICVKK